MRSREDRSQEFFKTSDGRIQERRRSPAGKWGCGGRIEVQSLGGNLDALKQLAQSAASSGDPQKEGLTNDPDGGVE